MWGLDEGLSHNFITSGSQTDRQTDRPWWVTKQLAEERTGTIIQEPFLETLKYLGNFLITLKRTVLDEPKVTKLDIYSDMRYIM